MLMLTKPDGHLLRSELALIGNMARTILDKEEKAQMMAEYDSILAEIESLPDSFGKVDIGSCQSGAESLCRKETFGK